MSLLARLLLVMGASITVVVFMSATLYFRYEKPLPMSGIELIVILFVPSLIPALVFGYIAYSIPAKLRLRCRSCGWTHTFRVPRTRVRRRRKAPPPVVEASSSEDSAALVGESERRAQAIAWIDRQLAAGRDVEQLTEDLIASGWTPDVAAELTQRCAR